MNHVNRLCFVLQELYTFFFLALCEDFRRVNTITTESPRVSLSVSSIIDGAVFRLTTPSSLSTFARLVQIIFHILLFVRHNRTTSVIRVTNMSQHLENIQEIEGHFLRFKPNADGVIDRKLWAYPCQRANAVKHGSVVTFYTSFNTND